MNDIEYSTGDLHCSHLASFPSPLKPSIPDQWPGHHFSYKHRAQNPLFNLTLRETKPGYSHQCVFFTDPREEQKKRPHIECSSIMPSHWLTVDSIAIAISVAITENKNLTWILNQVMVHLEACFSPLACIITGLLRPLLRSKLIIFPSWLLVFKDSI